MLILGLSLCVKRGVNSSEAEAAEPPSAADLELPRTMSSTLWSPPLVSAIITHQKEKEEKNRNASVQWNVVWVSIKSESIKFSSGDLHREIFLRKWLVRSWKWRVNGQVYVYTWQKMHWEWDPWKWRVNCTWWILFRTAVRFDNHGDWRDCGVWTVGIGIAIWWSGICQLWFRLKIKNSSFLEGNKLLKSHSCKLINQDYVIQNNSLNV